MGILSARQVPREGTFFPCSFGVGKVSSYALSARERAAREGERLGCKERARPFRRLRAVPHIAGDARQHLRALVPAVPARKLHPVCQLWTTTRPGRWPGKGPQRFIREPFDAESVAAGLEDVAPRRSGRPAPAKRCRRYSCRRSRRKGRADAVPGGLGAYRAAARLAAFPRRGVERGRRRAVRQGRDLHRAGGRRRRRSRLPALPERVAATGGGGARIIYNYEELAAQVGTLPYVEPLGEVLAVRVHEKHAQCEVHLMRDLKGRRAVLGVSDTLSPLGVHVANVTNVFPARSLSTKIEKRRARPARRSPARSGLAGYAVFHFGIDDAGQRTRSGCARDSPRRRTSSSLGSGVDIARAATAVASATAVAAAVKAAAKKPRTVVIGAAVREQPLPRRGRRDRPYKISSRAPASASRRSSRRRFSRGGRPAPRRARDLFETAADARREPNVLPLLAAPRTRTSSPTSWRRSSRGTRSRR